MKGVMFDFSGTLFRIDSTARWLDGYLAATALVLDAAERAELVARLEEFGALPGGVPPRTLPAELADAWAIRDLGAAEHRTAYAGLARAALAGAAEPPTAVDADVSVVAAFDAAASDVAAVAAVDADALYDRHMDPDAWQPYADAGPVLRELRRRGIPVAVVSNIGWDLRPIFRRHGLDEFVDVYLLSFEFGAQKPEPTIFQEACDRLGLAPADVLMVGDDVPADGAAAALGCAFHRVDHLPVEQRPDGLRPVLDLLG
ncbi:HAD-IA family hydrolase [Kitasatospora terrestris]